MSTQISPRVATITIFGSIFVIGAAMWRGGSNEPKAAETRARNAAVLKTMTHSAHTDMELAKRGKVRVGMITEQCRIAWGEPQTINEITDARGTHEQWIYPSGNSLVFDDEILAAIQKVDQ